MYAWDVCIVHIFHLCMCVCNYMWKPDIDVLYLPQSISTSLFVKDSSIHPFINLFFVCLCMSVCHMCVTAFRSQKKGHWILLNLELQVILLEPNLVSLEEQSVLLYLCTFFQLFSCLYSPPLFSLWVGNSVSH